MNDSNKQEKKSQMIPSPKQIAELNTHDLGEALLNLAKELWVTKDRLFIMENILIEGGQLLPESVKNYHPSEELQQALAKERERFLSTVIASIQDKNDV